VPGEAFDAGYVFPGERPRITHDFVVSNTTTEPVRIVDVEKTCSCTTFELGKSRLAPGDTTTLKMIVNTENAYMTKFARCILHTDHPRFKDWAYTLGFVSLPFAVVDPDSLDLGTFGDDGSGSNAVRRVTLDPFAHSKVELKCDHFIVPGELSLDLSSNPEHRRLGPGVWNSRYVLAIALSPRGREAIRRDSPSGIHQGVQGGRPLCLRRQECPLRPDRQSE
jgi:hypothetical protein